MLYSYYPQAPLLTILHGQQQGHLPHGCLLQALQLQVVCGEEEWVEGVQAAWGAGLVGVWVSQLGLGGPEQLRVQGEEGVDGEAPPWTTARNTRGKRTGVRYQHVDVMRMTVRRIASVWRWWKPYLNSCLQTKVKRSRCV